MAGPMSCGVVPWSLAALDGIEPLEVVQALGAERRRPPRARGARACARGPNSFGGRRRTVTDTPERPEDVRAFMESVELGEDAAEDELPPPGAPVMVVRSLRLPVELDQRVKAAAQHRGVPTSTLVREWIELELTALEQDQPISRADALRALATLRPLGAADRSPPLIARRLTLPDA
jgi:predicted DNA-binding protein